MSTVFAIFKKTPPTTIDGDIEWDKMQPGNEYVEVAFRASHGIILIKPFDIIINHLSDSTKIYPIDNTPQGIYNIGNLKHKINN